MKKTDRLVWVLLFIVFGLVQYNDPDGWLWMIIYGSAALISFLSYRSALPRILYMVMIGVYLLGAIYLWPQTYQGLSLKDGFAPSIEEARESLGLVICAAGMFWLLIRTKK